MLPAMHRTPSARCLVPLLGAVVVCSLTLPGPRARAAGPPSMPAAQDVEVPFDFSQGVVIFDVDFGGSRPARMMLDTGDADSLLDVASARALGLPLDMQDLRTAGSGEGAVTYYKTTQGRVRVGGAEFTGQPLVVMPISKNLLDDTGVRCEGTLGYDFFKGRVVQIDYPAQKLRLLSALPPSNPQTAASSANVPLQWRKYHSASPPLVTTDQLRVGDRAVCAQIDTCFAHSLILFTTKLPWLESQPAAGTEAAHYENATLAAATLAAPLALGNLSFRANPVAYLAGEDAHTPETEIAAVIGNRFFQHGVLTIDFKTDRITAEWK